MSQFVTMTVTALHHKIIIIIIIIHRRLQYLTPSDFVSLYILFFSVMAPCCLVVVTEGLKEHAASFCRVAVSVTGLTAT